MKQFADEIKFEAIIGQAIRRKAHKIAAFLEKKILRPFIAKFRDLQTSLIRKREAFTKAFSRTLKY